LFNVLMFSFLVLSIDGKIRCLRPSLLNLFV
jgi:hypothetical protein